MQVESDDDQEQDSSALTIAAERRRLQLNTSAVFTTAGPQAAASSSSGPRLGASGRSKGRVTAAAAAAGLFNTAQSGGAGAGGGSVFAPAGEWRIDRAVEQLQQLFASAAHTLVWPSRAHVQGACACCNNSKLPKGTPQLRLHLYQQQLGILLTSKYIQHQTSSLKTAVT